MGNYRRAILEYKKAAELAPTMIAPRLRLAEAYIALKEFGKAVEECSSVIRRSPRADAYYLRGLAYLNEGTLDAAERDLKTAVKADESYAEAYVALGDLLLQKAEIKRAELSYAKALEIDPNLSSAHRRMGDLYAMSGKIEEAISCYKNAVEADPGFALNYNNLAWLLASTERDLEEAQKLAEKAISIDPRSPILLDTLGYIYYAKGMYHKAITTLTAAKACDQGNPTIAYHLGMTYWKIGEDKRAAKELREALNLDPSFEGADEARRVLNEMKRRRKR